MTAFYSFLTTVVVKLGKSSEIRGENTSNQKRVKEKALDIQGLFTFEI